MGLFDPKHLEFYDIGMPGDGSVASINPSPPAAILVGRWRAALKAQFDSANHQLQIRRILGFADSPGTWTYALRTEPDVVEFLNELRILAAE
jgi:hypothetical protein